MYSRQIFWKLVREVGFYLLYRTASIVSARRIAGRVLARAYLDISHYRLSRHSYYQIYLLFHFREYCARIILVNSMVWTCEMTGKSNLTYSEALTTEKAARKQLKDFPMELRIPILYIAERTNRCSFAEMSEDIFNYVRDRYFVGETVEACLEGDNWCEAHILSVTAQKQHPDRLVLTLWSKTY